ncbi:MAG TPA: hypothetical protein VHV51_05690 [Polyangiaceae bacterium]|jgi:hypothetical protein|nr:hypothetical protein [Polyangiaceae bacterium]
MVIRAEVFLTRGEKFFADGSEGFLAHLDGDLLFVKTFPDLAKTAQAPKEAEIELYADGAGNFVEVEQQGAYVEIGAHASSTWVVKWALARVPESVRRAAAIGGWFRSRVRSRRGFVETTSRARRKKMRRNATPKALTTRAVTRDHQ